MADCIYCLKTADGSEHWLPRGLGTFGELQMLHDTICTDCNVKIGEEADAAFLKTGPETIFRAGLGIKGRRGAGTNPYLFNAATTQPAKATNVGDESDDVEESGLLFETVLGEEGLPEGRFLQQIVVEDEGGNRRAIPLNHQWSADVLRHALEYRGIRNAAPKEIYIDPELLEGVRPLLSAVFPNHPGVQHFARTGAGQRVRTIGFEHTIGPDYFRGVAKIALHGALRFVPALDGHAWEFNSLRRFIRYSEMPFGNPVQRRKRTLIDGLGDGMALRDWAHIIAIETGGSGVFVTLQFFVGPIAHPPVWVVRLGRRPPGLPDLNVAYIARYFDQPDAQGVMGDIAPLLTQRPDVESAGS